MESRYVFTRSASMGDIARNKALIRVLRYVILDSGEYSWFGYPDIRIPVEITSFESNLHSETPFHPFSLFM